MSENFLRFKKRLNSFRIIKASMTGVSLGLTLSGVWLVLVRLGILGLAPLTALFVGLGVALVSGGLIFLLSGRSDKSFAEELDAKFCLDARVQTMVEYSGQSGEMIAMQRQDADKLLSAIPTKAYKFKGLWIYISALVVAAAILAVGLILPEKREYIPPEEIEPFELTRYQEEELLRLISNVETSGMEEEFSVLIVEELRWLHAELKLITTRDEMELALAKSMAMIMSVTYKSSTATEMLNSIWDSKDIYLRHLAKTLDTSSWNSRDWGDFSEKLAEYTATLMGDNEGDENAVVGKERLKSALDSMIKNIDLALMSSGLDDDDEMYIAIQIIFIDKSAGLKLIFENIDSMSEEEVREALTLCLRSTGSGHNPTISEQLFAAISLNWINASTGENVMTNLGRLFLGPVPEFERPDFFKRNESVGGGQTGEDKENDENKPSQGGIGGGTVYGSDDIVLDPMTGQPVRYGDLIDEYYARMEKILNNYSYTDEQKQAIRKYFEMLYSGIKKEEGN